jgi:hypothetical protein
VSDGTTAGESGISVANAPVSYGAFEVTVGHDPNVPSGLSVLDQVAEAGIDRRHSRSITSGTGHSHRAVGHLRNGRETARREAGEVGHRGPARALARVIAAG